MRCNCPRRFQSVSKGTTSRACSIAPTAARSSRQLHDTACRFGFSASWQYWRHIGGRSSAAASHFRFRPLRLRGRRHLLWSGIESEGDDAALAGRQRDSLRVFLHFAVADDLCPNDVGVRDARFQAGRIVLTAATLAARLPTVDYHLGLVRNLDGQRTAVFRRNAGTLGRRHGHTGRSRRRCGCRRGGR